MKFRKFASTIALSLLVANCSTIEIAEPPIVQSSKVNWPNGAKAAIAITYDDALDTHLDVVQPALDQAGLKGTFYITLNRKSWETRMTEWGQLAENGHELGNKTIYHACRASQHGREWVESDKDLDKYSIRQMEDELDKANEILTTVDNKKTRTFAYPCGESVTSDGSYYNAIKPLFVGARSVYDIPYQINDPYNFQTFFKEGATGDELIAYIQSVVLRGESGTLLFHGVGGDYMTVSAQAHQQVLDYLVAHQDEIWVDTVENIATYITQHKHTH